ncbi:MAG: cysteine synthase family protein [Defluviitaleaceae bacterium]|nr:cysteine synthase family protein [Defluviitaleaceae bacterium]
MDKYITSITQAIGKTPLLRLDRLAKIMELDGHIYAKLEQLNPTYSKKDRIALGMIENAEKKGLLRPGQPVLEMTSGNTGTSIAMVCSAKGYPFICVISKGNSVERVRMIKALGGQVVLVDQSPTSLPGKVSGDDMILVEVEAERIVAQTGAFFFNQFCNHDNSVSHEPAAMEMWQQSQGKIQAFADFIGTGGTFMGYSRGLKHHNPNVRCYAVEPCGCAFYKGEVRPGSSHIIQGGGYSKHMAIVDRSYMDGFVTITSEEAGEATKLLAKAEGVFSGFSSGANLMAAIKLLRGTEKGGHIGIVINDCGLKYMSTNLFC